MDGPSRKADELSRIAGVCGLDAKDALEDIASSMEAANRLVLFKKFRGGRGDTEPLDNAALKEILNVFLGEWWVVFLQQYFLKCNRRWQAKCLSSRDYQSMESLWLQSFEPLYITGCTIAKDAHMKSYKDTFAELALESGDLTKIQREELEAWVDRLARDMDEVLLVSIAEFKEKQRRVMAETLKALREYDNASLLGKLKRRLFG